MARLPQPGADNGRWGEILNDFLGVSHSGDGTLNANSVTANSLAPGAVTSASLATNAVTSAALASNSVATTALLDESVTDIKLSLALRSKLNGISGTNTGDQDLTVLVPKTTTVNGKPLSQNIALTAADLSITKTDVGLSNVDNVSDSNKPVSTAQANAIATSGRAVAKASGFVVLGDSISSYNTNGADVWHKILGTLSNGRLPHRGHFATAGATLAEIETAHMASVLAITRRPGACVIAAGTNDLGRAGYDAAASRATLLRMIATLSSVGIMPILWTLPPRDDSTTVNAYVQRWNVWVRYTVQSMGLPLIDTHAALTDPATGKYLAVYRLDDVHPNTDGHFQIGKRTALDSDFTRRFPSSTPYLSTTKLDAANLIPSGNYLFDSGVNGAGVPVGWSAYGQAAYTISVVSEGTIAGKWLRMTKAASQAAQGGLQYNITTGFSAGDRIAYAVRVKMSGDDSGAKAVFGVGVASRAAGVAIATSTMGGGGGTFDGIVYGEFVVPATTDTLRLDISVTGTPVVESYVQFAQPTIVNLTVLGVS